MLRIEVGNIDFLGYTKRGKMEKLNSRAFAC